MIELEGVQGTGQGLQNPAVGLGHQLSCTLQHVADGELPHMAGAMQERREALVTKTSVRRHIDGPTKNMGKKGLHKFGSPTGHTLKTEHARYDRV